MATLYQQAQKELNRIMRAIKRLEKIGYEFKLPPKYEGATRHGDIKTKWSRAEVESLKKTKPKDLYKYSNIKTPTVKKITLHKQAQKEINRIRRTVNEMEKRGYEFNLPPKFAGATRYGEVKTKWSRAEVESLKQTKAKQLYQYAKYVTPEGKTVSGVRGREIEREKAGRKAAETRKIREYERRVRVKTPRSYEQEERYERDMKSIISSAIIEGFLDEFSFAHHTTDLTVAPKTAAFIDRMRGIYSDAEIADFLQKAQVAKGLLNVVHDSYDWNIDKNLFELESYFGKSIGIEDNHIDDITRTEEEAIRLT